MNERLFSERRQMTPIKTRIGHLRGYGLRFTVTGAGLAYLNLIREAARQRGLPADYVACLDRVEARE